MQAPLLSGVLSRISIYNQDIIKQVIDKLVERSCAFHVEPLPDGEYEITTKDEQHLEIIVKELELNGPDNDAGVFVIEKGRTP